MKNFLSFFLSLCLITTGQAQVVFYDNAEQNPVISWGTPKTKGYYLFTYGDQVFGRLQSNGGGGLAVAEGEMGAPKPRAGNKSYRFTIVKRTDYPPCCEWTRAEMYWGGGNQEITGAEWFAQSIFIPNDWVHDNRRLAMSFDFKFPDAVGPASLHLFMEGGQWQINRQYPQGANAAKQNLGAVQKGVWTDFVIHRNFKNDASGFIEVFINKVKVYSYYGANYPGGEGYVLFGMYKWQYASPDGQGEGSGSYNGPITAYFDELKIMDARGSLDAVSPGGSVTPPVVTPPVVVPPPVVTPTAKPVFAPITPDLVTEVPTLDVKVSAKHTTATTVLNYISYFTISQVSGPNAAKVTQFNQSGFIPTTTNFKFENLIDGTYEFKVTAIDFLGGSSVDNFKITKKTPFVDTRDYIKSAVVGTKVITVNGVQKTITIVTVTYNSGKITVIE